MSDIGSSLAGRAFRVTEIEGVPVLERPVADLTFSLDGRVTGCATVNRLMGEYVVDGDLLTCGPLAGTMMAGPPEAMDQEQRLHRALTQPLTVSVDQATDRVELQADGRVALVLVPDDRTEQL